MSNIKIRIPIIMTALVALSFSTFGMADTRCKVVPPEYSYFNCITEQGVSAQGWLDPVLGEGIRVKEAKLGATIRAKQTFLDYNLKSNQFNFSAPVSFPGNGERLGVLLVNQVYYGSSVTTKDSYSPAVISRDEFEKRYLNIGASKEGAAIIVNAVYEPLLALPTDSDIRPGKWYGGQSLFVQEFTTSDDQVVLYANEPYGYGGELSILGSNQTPGNRIIKRADNANLGIFNKGAFRDFSTQSIRNQVQEEARDSASAAQSALYFKGNKDSNWTLFIQDDRGRYAAQLKRAEEDYKIPANLVPDQIGNRYFEGRYGKKVYIVTLNAKNEVVQAHFTFDWQEPLK